MIYLKHGRLFGSEDIIPQKIKTKDQSVGTNNAQSINDQIAINEWMVYEEANKSKNNKIFVNIIQESIYKMCLFFDESINPSRPLEEVHA